LGCSSEAWEPCLRSLVQRRLDQPVIAPDMPGYGGSPGPAKTLGIQALADWSARLLEVLQISRVHVAGNSMGCQVALALARQHPARVGGMVLVGPTTGRSLVPFWRFLSGLLLDSVREPLRYNAVLLKMVWQMGLRRYVATIGTMMQDDPLAQIDAVRAPCLIVRGRRDAIVPATVARQLAAALPHGSLVELESVAHAVQFNTPEPFTQLALAFLVGNLRDEFSFRFDPVDDDRGSSGEISPPLSESERGNAGSLQRAAAAALACGIG
jgi:pimeloyl-ACP methyl ester carboxylesterase